MFLIVDHVVAVVVVAVVAISVVVLAFVVDAAARFDVVISADIAAVFHLVVVLVLFAVAVGASDFENGNGDFAVSC